MKVLFVAPHADDETLGAGGTIARMIAEKHEVTVAVMTGPNGLLPPQLWDTVRAEACEAMEVLGGARLLFRDIPAACVADQPIAAINKEAAAVIEQVGPEMLFVPFLWDIHRDHREIFHAFTVASRVSSNVGRSIREIYAYETLSETHWNTPYAEPGFFPNVHIDISSYLEKKLKALACYRSQIQEAPSARSIEAARAQAVWRGALAGLHAAEAFVLIRRII